MLKNQIHNNQPGHVSDKRTMGQRLSDNVSTYVGSWRFIILFLSIFVFWIILNGFILAARPLDKFPFILLNLSLSLLATIQAPIILMSQNRAAEWDRKKAQMDLEVDRRAEKKVTAIQQELKEIRRLLEKK